MTWFCFKRWPLKGFLTFFHRSTSKDSPSLEMTLNMKCTLCINSHICQYPLSPFMLGFHFHFPQVYPHTHDLRILGKDKSKWQLSPLHLSLSFIRDTMGKWRQPYYDQFSYRAISHLTAAFRRMALEGARQRRPGCLSWGIWWGSTFLLWPGMSVGLVAN